MRVCPTCNNRLVDSIPFCPNDGTALHDDPLLGAVLADRYLVCSRLDAGGMGAVYLARHGALQRDVVIKVLLPHLQRNPRSLARFKREAQSAALIDHPNVVYVLDFAHTAEGTYYIVMEHVAGVPLRKLFKQQQPLPVPRALHILTQICSAIARAHELGIVHRDLKPENVLLTARGVDGDFVKVCDFGLARPVGAPEASGISLAGELFGTPLYMAPEQWTGGTIDGRTDVYAFGVLAYELLTGTTPFVGEFGEVMLAHLQSTPPAFARKDSAVPPVLEQVFRSCLAKDPRQRMDAATLLTMLRSSVAPPKNVLSVSYSEDYQPTIEEPTRYLGTRLDEGAEVPQLLNETVRLHTIRVRHLQQAITAAWSKPPTFAERFLSTHAEVLARMRSNLETARKAGREAERFQKNSEKEKAKLRAQIVAWGASDEDHAKDRRTVDRQLASVEVRADRALRIVHARITAEATRIAAEGALLLQLSEELMAALISNSTPAVKKICESLTPIERPLHELHEVLGELTLV